jgi:hypothetical protein
MLSKGFAIRQSAAFICAGMLAWDYFRDPDVVGNFSLWALAVHFIYFQLPIKSRALAYMHATSFIGSCLVPVMYGVLLYWNPTLEHNHMVVWDVAWSTVVTRSTLIYFAPLSFHLVDVYFHRQNVIHAYRMKPQSIMFMWSFASFAGLGFFFELVFPESEETNDLQGIDRDTFLHYNRTICFFWLLLSVFLLYKLVLRDAYAVKSSHSS